MTSSMTVYVLWTDPLHLRSRNWKQCAYKSHVVLWCLTQPATCDNTDPGGGFQLQAGGSHLQTAWLYKSKQISQQPCATAPFFPTKFRLIAWNYFFPFDQYSVFPSVFSFNRFLCMHFSEELDLNILIKRKWLFVNITVIIWGPSPPGVACSCLSRANINLKPVIFFFFGLCL